MTTLPEAQESADCISLAAKVNACFRFEIKNSKCELSVVKFTVDERISHPYEMELILATLDDLDLGALLDRDCLLTINTGASNRSFHGVVRECTCIGYDGAYSIFHLLAVPSLWLLCLEQDCRIFQDMNVQDIVLKILDESRIGSDHIRMALTDKRRKREYCVQYRETDLNFVSRLLEEEGIFYFFEHQDDKHILVLADTPAAYVPIQGDQRISYNGNGGMVPSEESVIQFIYSRRLYPEKVAQRDFNYQRVGLDLTSAKQEKPSSMREVYDYPGKYYEQQKGNILTQIRQERFRVLGETAEGTSNSPRLMPGYRWEMVNHDFEGVYLTMAITHHGSQSQALHEQATNGGSNYHNEFLVIPSSVVVRPQVGSVKPIVTGLQTATVVGPQGEEIHTDKHGRVKVQFHWDRLGKNDGRNSCWLRVAQSWGGGNRGAQFIPRIGDEVLVDFLEGDPDRPMVTGSVYNGDNLPIHDLDKNITQSGFRTKTHKGEGFNELRFDDANGSEEVFLHSQKDWNITVRNNESKTVGNDLVSQVGKKLSVVAGEQMQFTCGNASILLDQSGKIVIHGSEVFVSGTTLHLDGTLIKLNMGG